MDEHPSDKTLESFLRGGLDPAEQRRVLEHLLRGCGRCARGIAPLAELALHPQRTPPVAGPEEEEKYDAAIERAYAAVRLHGRRAPQVKRQTVKALDTLSREGIDGLLRLKIGPAAIAEAGMARARELRHSDPDQMVSLTELAALSAFFLDGYPPESAADLQALTLAEHANALRIVHRYDAAEHHLMAAFRHAEAGTGDRWLSARLYDLLGSYRGSQYRYGEAVRAFKRVSTMYETLGDRHLSGRAQIAQGLYLGYDGAPVDAIRLLEKGARKIDPAREPELPKIAIHNRLLFLAEAGRFPDAMSLLMEQRDLLDNTWESKLLGIEGRVYAGLGHLDMSEGAFREGKARLLEAGDSAHAGLLALDLAALLLRQGRTAEGRAEAEKALAIFQDLEIEQEARRALNLLSDALQSKVATPSFVQRVVGFLRDVERRPWLQFKPAFE